MFEKNRGFNGFVKRRSGRFDNRFQVFEHAGGLLGDVAFYKLAGRWVKRNLPGRVYKPIRRDRLRIRPDCLGALGGQDHFFQRVLLW